ncbi:Protein of uncharacterised function (DUF2714) [Metamycoplasma cloacale]|uniref:DUF2714 domain-containing protein n=1 Tax=Metamycoplasma cloacale TaxID=92401 RepID=A0A2Z4LLK1_9BACT|nr:DUF2714 domain-containing protein [Metamycoplasma cloacale]AWX42575.1 DUF2714 domain-containing protein [Metamycoplasma cloacale]VEU79716.1 Protein of uncharacterised function (DUF2714) [Metamycoplasma cloacale]
MKLNNSKELKKLMQQQQNFQNQLFNDWTEIANSSSFVSFGAFNNQFLVVNNLSNQDNEYQKFIQELTAACNKKQDLNFSKFNIHFTRNERFSFTDLIPEIKWSESSNVLSYSVFDANNSMSIKTKYNNLFHELLQKGFYVEIVPNIAILITGDKKTKSIFNSKLINEY